MTDPRVNMHNPSVYDLMTNGRLGVKIKNAILDSIGLPSGVVGTVVYLEGFTADQQLYAVNMALGLLQRPFDHPALIGIHIDGVLKAAHGNVQVHVARFSRLLESGISSGLTPTAVSEIEAAHQDLTDASSFFMAATRVRNELDLLQHSKVGVRAGGSTRG